MSELVRRVLWLGIEDFSGLWEVVWELNTLMPDRDPAQNRDLARDIVHGLLAEGLVQIFQCKEPDGQQVAVSLETAEEVLAGDEAWEPPEFNGLSWRIGATEKGSEAYGMGG